MPNYLKFAVIGIPGSGATTFIRAVEETIGGTGRLDLQIKLGLLPKAQDQWQIVLSDKAGIVVMLDSADLATFGQAQALIEVARRYSSVPVIVIANKQDTPGALQPEQIRSHLALQPNVLIIPCVSKDRTSVRVAMRQLTEWTLRRKSAQP